MVRYLVSRRLTALFAGALCLAVFTIPAQGQTATHLTVSAPSTAPAGAAFSVTVTALTSGGSVATNYLGTVQFTTSDSAMGSVVPANYTFVAGDSGMHTFTSGALLITAGSRTITAADTGTASITGTSAAITVTAVNVISVANGCISLIANSGCTTGIVDAINALNANGGGTIQLAVNGQYSVTAPSDWWYGPNAFPATSSAIVIQGNGATISRASGSSKFRFFYVAGGYSTLPAGNLSLSNLTLQGGLAQGGNGGGGDAGGGGGAGMGGAIYNQGQVTLTNVALTQNTAQGGAGGSGNPGTTADSGGGGIGGDGGSGCGYSIPGFLPSPVAGSGGGFKSSGSCNTNNGGAAGGGFLGSEGGNVVNGGTSAYGGNGGNGTGDTAGGGGGGYSPGSNGGSGGSQPGATINGALGAGSSFVAGYGGPSGAGGGAFGGGGGVSANYESGPGGGGGVGGGGGGESGGGGFGGGGAGGAEYPAGGGSVFGGGGGANIYGGSPGSAGFGGGNGTTTSASYGASGGGGGGFGGAIFNHGGTLNMNQSTASNNQALGGSGGNAGQGYGGVIFNLNGSMTLQSSSLSGNAGNSASAGNSIYVMSSNAGKTAASQTPAASLTEDVNYNVASGDLVQNQANSTVTVTTSSATRSQTITFGAPGNHTFGDASFSISATASSGLTVSLASTTSAVCSVSGNTVTLVAAGVCEIAASQAGNSTYAPASNVYRSFTVAGPVTQFTVTAPATATAGSAFNLTVTAVDQSGYTVTAYRGTVQITKSDSGVGSAVPVNYTFQASDSGIHVFTNGVTLVTAGNQTVAATDTTTGTITGTSSAIAVTSGAAARFTVTAPSTATAGTAFSVTVTAKDLYGNTTTGYVGTAHFAKSDSGAGSTVPVNYIFQASDNGAHTFTNGVTLVTSGSQTVTATDTLSSTMTGTSSAITVSALTATTLAVSAPSTVTVDSPFSVTVTAQDQYGNTAPSYRGTVHFTKTDSGTGSFVPANYAFVAGDNGAHTFTNGAILVSSGNQTVTATDTVTSTITGTSGSINILGAGTITSLSGNPSPALYGQSVTLTATVISSGSPVTSGTVTFVDTTTSTTLATLALNGSGVASTIATGLTATIHTFTATFGPANGYFSSSSQVTVAVAGLATHLAVSAPSTATAGSALTVTVTAQDQFGNTAPSYRGTAQFTKTDSGAGSAVAANYTFVSGDSGAHTFPAGVTLVTSGSQTVTATDTATASITGTSAISVSPAAATRLAVSAPSAVVTASAFSITVTAQDPYGNTVPGYLGTVQFTKSDSGGGSAVPANYAFVAADNGGHTFTNGVTLVTAGNQTITATDTVTGTITGTAGPIHAINAQSTTTTLASSASPSILGRAVAFTATVSPTPDAGYVMFYDGVSILGVATVNNGQAILTTSLLLTGSHSVKAYFPGDPFFFASTSATVAQSVVGLGEAVLLTPPSVTTVASAAYSMVVGDFNGDGIPDLAVANGNTVSVLLGKGDGTFQSPVTYAANANFVAIGDFNGDGKTDLVTADQVNGSVDVLLGNGDGTFQAAVSTSAGSTPAGIVVGDFNGDGKADVAVAGTFNGAQGRVSVLLGNGDGTFQTGVSFTYGNTGPSGILAGDFNGDGSADLAVANANSNSIDIYLGNGDGSFQAAVNYAVQGGPGPMVTTDFNNDGKLDLLVINLGSQNGSLLFGNGNGTFQAASTISLGSSPISVAVGDLYADGGKNLVVSEGSSVNEYAILGNGTFQLDRTYSSINATSTVVLADFNGDGWLDAAVAANLVAQTSYGTVNMLLGGGSPLSQTITFGTLGNQTLGTAPFTVSATASSGLAVSFASITTAVCSVSGSTSGTTVTLVATGTCTIQATQAGNGTSYVAATPVSQSFQVTGQSQTITFPALANQALGTAPFAVSATASSGLAVSFASVTTPVCTVSGFTVTLVAAGACAIQATQIGNATYAAAASVTQSFVVVQIGGSNGAPLLVGSAAGSSSVLLPVNGVWTATSNSSFLHISAGSAGGTGSSLVVFSYDAFSGTGTRTGTLTVGGATVNVTQAGTNYVQASPVTPIVTSGISQPEVQTADAAGNLFFADNQNSAIKKWTNATGQVSTIVSSGVSRPFAVTRDGAGNLYIADNSGGIKMWNASTQQLTVLANTAGHFYSALAADFSGNIYYTQQASFPNFVIAVWNATT
jgi:hypothetical protein